MNDPRRVAVVMLLLAGTARASDGSIAFDRAEKLRAEAKYVDAIVEYDRACTLAEMRACSELARACTAASALLQVTEVAALLTAARCDALLQQTCKAGDDDSCGELEVREVQRKTEDDEAAKRADAMRALEKAAKERGARIAIDKSGSGWRAGASVRVRVNGADVRDSVVVKKLTATIDVTDGKQKSRRVATLLPDAQYTVQGNPCAQWTLTTTNEPARDDADSITTLHVDARALPARFFPLRVHVGALDETGQELAAPGVVPLDVPDSAMCIGAGARVRVVSKAAPKPLFDAEVVPHAHMTSVLRIDGVDKWTLAVDP